MIMLRQNEHLIFTVHLTVAGTFVFNNSPFVWTIEYFMKRWNPSTKSYVSFADGFLIFQLKCNFKRIYRRGDGIWGLNSGQTNQYFFIHTKLGNTKYPANVSMCPLYLSRYKIIFFKNEKTAWLCCTALVTTLNVYFLCTERKKQQWLKV